MCKFRAKFKCRSIASRLGLCRALKSPPGWTVTAKHSASKKSPMRLARRMSAAVSGAAVTRTRIL